MSGSTLSEEHTEKESVRQEDVARSHAVIGKRERSGGEHRRAKRQKVADVPKPLIKDLKRPGLPHQTDPSSYIVPDRPSPPERADDKDGHYVFELGDNLTSRYKILSKMGEGTFGRVLECWDRKNKIYVAIKVVRNVQKYRDAAMIELEVLNTLEANDPTGRWHCVFLREWFDYRGHVCMVFEKLGLSLYDYLRKNSYQPFSYELVAQIRSFGRQLLESVAFLHQLTLIHTDLKPENILLSLPEPEKPHTGRGDTKTLRSTDIKVIDFGSATFDDQYHSTIVSTRHYRAPEVILGLGWTYPCDIWSVGCILVELATGDALFQTHENLEHLAMMEMVLGRIPKAMAKDAARSAIKYFTSKHTLNWPEGAQNKRSQKAVQKLQSLGQLLADMGHSSLKPHLPKLLDLLMKMLRYNPAERILASDALAHPFFTGAELGDANGAYDERDDGNGSNTASPSDSVAAAAATLVGGHLRNVSGDGALDSDAERPSVEFVQDLTHQQMSSGPYG